MTTADRRAEDDKVFGSLLDDEEGKWADQINGLQEELARERDARREDRFVYLTLLTLLLDVTFFTVMPNFAGPVALLVLELLILIPLANRLGMQEIGQLISGVLTRVAGRASGEE